MPSRAGDVKNSLANLRAVLRKIKFSGELDVHGAKQGFPEVFLPLIHYAFLAYSGDLARFLGRSGYELYGKSDLKFIEGIYRVLRDEFKYTPKLNKRQFFSSGFAEQKMIFVTDVVKFCINKHNEISHEKKVAGMSASGPPGHTYHQHRHQHDDVPRHTHYDVDDGEIGGASERSGSQSSPSRRHHHLTDVLQPSHAEFGPRSDDPTARMVHGDGGNAGSPSRGGGHTDTIVSLTRSPSAQRRHNAQMEAAMQAAGVTVERNGLYADDDDRYDGDNASTDYNTNSRPVEHLQPQPLPPLDGARGGVDISVMLHRHAAPPPTQPAQPSHHPYTQHHSDHHVAPSSTGRTSASTIGTPTRTDADTALHTLPRAPGDAVSATALLHSGDNQRPTPRAHPYHASAVPYRTATSDVVASSPLRHHVAAPHGWSRGGVSDAVPIETFYVPQAYASDEPAFGSDHRAYPAARADHDRDGGGAQTGGAAAAWTTVPLYASALADDAHAPPAPTGSSTVTTAAHIVQTMNRLTQFVGALTSRIAVVEQQRPTASSVLPPTQHAMAMASHDALVAELRDNNRDMHERLDMLHSDLRLNMASVSARMTLLESKVTALEHRSTATSAPPSWAPLAAPPDVARNTRVDVPPSATWAEGQPLSPTRSERTAVEASLHDVNTTLEHLEHSALHHSASVHTPPRPGDISSFGFRPPSTSSPKAGGGGRNFDSMAPGPMPMQPL